ncbi:CLUMA_CG005801, isoform A [Clunio marinus]|uniref:CLUMA_CG005801, isoform A n=1 Tax=Clunio marinus TaxID=568069 RepID=A0A1J1HW57_9DIPT|nr:CLUMA_CG005801, isoform A [Clunio marinus]
MLKEQKKFLIFARLSHEMRTRKNLSLYKYEMEKLSEADQWKLDFVTSNTCSTNSKPHRFYS